MLEGHADVVLGEAIKPAAVAYQRLTPAHWISGIWPGLGFIAGSVLLMAANALLLRAGLYSDVANFVIGAIFLVGGLLAGFQFAARRHRMAFLDSLRRMGSPDIFPTRFAIEEDRLRIDSGRLDHRIHWPAVLFVVKGEDHWLVQADSMTIAIPRRAFASTTAESAFVGAILDRISPEARRRSDNASQSRKA